MSSGLRAACPGQSGETGLSHLHAETPQDGVPARRAVESSFFPRYLFVVLDLERDRRRSVNGTFAVSWLGMCSDLPKPAPCGVGS